MKQPLSLEQMAHRLRLRGLSVEDEEQLRKLLFDHNYYRLSGYFRQFQVDPRSGDDAFEPLVTLQHVRDAYDFNNELTALLSPCLSRVELLLRSRFAYKAAHHFGPLAWYLDEENYLDAMPGRERYLEHLTDEIVRDKSPVTQRYVKGEDASGLPIWVAVEIATFGTLSKMLMHLRDTTAAREVADSLSYPWGIFQQSVHSVSVLRNRCAHHGQIWQRRMTISAPLDKKSAHRRREPAHDPQGPYPTILALKNLLRGADSQDPDVKRLEDFLAGSAHLGGVLFPKPR